MGTFSDTLYFEKIICPNSATLLDAAGLGQSFLWDDGSTASTYLATQAGRYHLTLFDGCEPGHVIWDIEPGPAVSVSPLGPLTIHQGEQILLEPLITNEGDTLALNWTDPQGGATLSCLDCPAPVAAPLRDTRYVLHASNGLCGDSVLIDVEVDRTRRIFTPNVFSPNDDGWNDFFYLQSPDMGIIKLWRVMDRWGNVLFSSATSALNDMPGGWDGRAGGELVHPGVYTWYAEIVFPDGEKKIYSGDVTVVR
jgi:gliding motility-associated-like protein